MEEGQRKREEMKGALRAASTAAIQCMAHKSEINRMFIEQLCAVAISASMLPPSRPHRGQIVHVLIMVFTPIVMAI